MWASGYRKSTLEAVLNLQTKKNAARLKLMDL